MERSSIIASVVAAGGILVAGSVASAAVINASASVEPEGMSHTIVAEPVTAVIEPVADVNTNLEAAGSVPALTEVTAEELPIVSVPDVSVPAAAPAAPAPAAAASTPRPAKTTKPRPKPAKTAAAAQQPASAPTSSSAAAPQVRAIPVDTAVSMVLKATDGGVVQNAVQTTRGGYDAWAVTVKRHDGSIVTGFVDQVDGIVFDWATVKEAPAPAPVAAATYSDDDHDDDHDDEHDDDDDHDDDDHGDDDDD